MANLRTIRTIDLRSRIYNAVEQELRDPKWYPFKSCINCLNFRKKTEICGLANQRPPAEVIVHACPKHEDVEDIPF